MRVFTAALLSANVLALAACAGAPEQNLVKLTMAEVGILSAGPGSAFLHYAQGAAAYLWLSWARPMKA